MNTYCAVIVNSAEEAMKAKHAAAVEEILALTGDYFLAVNYPDRGYQNGVTAIEYAAALTTLTAAREYVIRYHQWSQPVQLSPIIITDEELFGDWNV